MSTVTNQNSIKGKDLILAFREGLNLLMSKLSRRRRSNCELLEVIMVKSIYLDCYCFNLKT